ncbi:MAG: methyltransferase [Gammaproteobacteria bacterium]|nr:methyltransferase [Gammaproteobacteria bacterium]
MDNEEWLARLRDDIVFEETLLGQALTFHATWGLFSPREVDDGTRLLLRHVDVGEGDECLDLGCGYGPIGIALAKAAYKGRTLLVDKDFVAIEYARKNIAANGLSNCQAMLSNGFREIDDRCFDVIASNVPAKVGKELLQLLLHDARGHLKPGGRLYVVTVTGLRRFMEKHMRAVFGNYEKCKQGSHYTVAVARKAD